MSEELTQSHKDKLMSDLKLVIADAEELLKLTAGNVGDKASEMRIRMQARMEQAKADLVDLQDMAVVRVRDAGRAADAYVQDNPWRAVGIAAGVGLVVGMLISRR
ncbi:DUF883 family protein [Caenimonas koreensis]|uniref:DUF883 family protein n=1 Tax=Caenimonas koreensis DSM 17982 TaxID=1121255 RepID=A0A844B4V7_9BURK|nr:DUF883 family protein [Caenimonas koreensis DSM 17982]